jgi:hypothetical protein
MEIDTISVDEISGISDLNVRKGDTVQNLSNLKKVSKILEFDSHF